MSCESARLCANDVTPLFLSMLTPLFGDNNNNDNDNNNNNNNNNSGSQETTHSHLDRTRGHSVLKQAFNFARNSVGPNKCNAMRSDR